MFKIIALVSLMICCLVRHGHSSPADTDYYWKDYYGGDVPLDAIPGGYDKNGATTYVALVAHPGGTGLIVGTLYPGLYALSCSSVPNVDYRVTTHNITILVLCTRHKNRYKWVPTNAKNYDKLKGNLVRAAEYPIGRALYRGEMKVGRVFLPEPEHTGLWLAGDVNTDQYEHFRDFEILVYYEPCAYC